MPNKINMMAKKISPKSMELLNMAVADFYSNFSKSNISDSVASMIKKSIPVEQGEKVNPNEFNTIIDGASSLMVDAAVDEKIISLDEEPEKAAEYYLQSIAQISNKYSALESQIRRTYVVQGIESGDFPNYEENPNKFQAFLDSTFEMFNFSKEELREGYTREIALTKSMEEESIADSIKEKVVEDIDETEKNNQLFSDIIEEVENVKKEYDDADTTDGQKVATQEEKDKEERENADMGGGDDLGADAGGDMGEEGGDEGMGDNPDEGGDPSEDDIPLGDEGYDATAIHSNRSPMGEEAYSSADKAKKVAKMVSEGKQGPNRDRIRKTYAKWGMSTASLDEEDNPDVDYEDNTETPLDDSYSPNSPIVDNPDAEIENSEIDTYMNEDEDKQADFNEDDFAREEEEVMREIAQQYDLNIDTQGDSETPKDTINPYRGMGETQLEEVDDDIASNSEVNILSDENLKRRLVDESLLKYRMLPNYSAESISNLFIKLDGEKFNNLKKSVEKQMSRLKYNIEKQNDSTLQQKIQSFESNWKKAEDITAQREALLNDLGIAPRKIYSTENIFSLAITRNILNSYSYQCKDKKLPRVCEALKLNDEKLLAKEALVETIFDLGRKAKKLTKTSDIVKAREDFIEAEREAEKKMEDLNLDEKEVEMVDNLQNLLKLKEHKKIFQFDSLLNSYKAIFGTIEEKIKLSDELKDGTFNEKVVNNLKDKRGFLSKEEIDLVNRYIKGQDIASLRLSNPYAKFNLLEIKNRDVSNKKNYSQEFYANVAVVSKLLTTVYHTKEALLIGHDMSKDKDEMDSQLLSI